MYHAKTKIMNRALITAFGDGADDGAAAAVLAFFMAFMGRTAAAAPARIRPRFIAFGMVKFWKEKSLAKQ